MTGKKETSHEKPNFDHLHNSDVKTRLFNWIKLLVVGIVIESLLREKLYQYGINFIEILQGAINDNHFLIKLLQLLSLMATKYLVITSAIMFFNYLDMYSTLILVIIGGCGTIGTGFFKLIYKNPRPFFHEHWVKVYDCETGYGNPSGHSIVAVSIYLTLWKVLRKKNPFFEKYKKSFFMLLFFFICCILLSRLALGAHSLNQILLGIMEHCPGTPYSKTFDFEAYFMLAACSSLIGAYYGIYFDIKFNLSNSHEKWIEMNHGEKQWNKTGFIKGLMRLVLLIALLSLAFCLNFIISSRAHTNYVFILKNLVPYFCVNFALFGLGRSLSCKFNCANGKLDEIESEETKSG